MIKFHILTHKYLVVITLVSGTKKSISFIMLVGDH